MSYDKYVCIISWLCELCEQFDGAGDWTCCDTSSHVCISSSMMSRGSAVLPHHLHMYQRGCRIRTYFVLNAGAVYCNGVLTKHTWTHAGNSSSESTKRCLTERVQRTNPSQRSPPKIFVWWHTSMTKSPTLGWVLKHALCPEYAFTTGQLNFMNWCICGPSQNKQRLAR